MPDWRNPDDYRFTESLSREQWAWEFLRRNPEYCAEWRQFWTTWQALEADYGAPPQRDFIRWKSDPRAYVIENEGGSCHASDSCKVDGDKVLIECWLGAKWGFYKFPLDPATDMPLVGEQLSWREVAQGVVRVDSRSEDYLGSDAAKMALGFDLALPMKEQLERARVYLIATQRRLQKAGVIAPRRMVSRRERLSLCLRALDARIDGADSPELLTVLSVDDLPALEDEARALRDGGYRQLLNLPE